MSRLKVKEYKRFEDIKNIRNDGSEFWSARELAPDVYKRQGLPDIGFSDIGKSNVIK